MIVPNRMNVSENRPPVFHKHKFDLYFQQASANELSRDQLSDKEKVDIRKVILDGHAERITELSSFAQLIKYFEDHEVEYENEWNGFDHSEHLVKRLAMAEDLSSSLLVPEEMGLRSKVHNILGQNDQLDSIDNVKYTKFLSTRVANPSFTAQELSAVINKVSPSLFASFDRLAEESLLILNVLPGTTTRNSCAGHRKAVIHNVYFGDQYFSTTAFVSYKVTDPAVEKILLDKFKTLNVKSGQIEFIKTGDNQYMIRYRADATPEWQTKHPKVIYATSDEATQLRGSFFNLLNVALLDCLKSARAS